MKGELTYEEAEKLALRAIHDVDGRGMIGRGRNHLHQRVARAILTSEVKRNTLLSERTALLERLERAEANLETARKDRDAAEVAVEAAKAEVSEAVSRWCIRMADVREASGIGHKPMLDEVPGAIKARISEIEARAKAAESKLATLTEALEPFMAFARAVTDDRSPDYREWLREAKDWMVAFSFAGQSVTLGQLRALAALSQTQEEKTNG